MKNRQQKIENYFRDLGRHDPDVAAEINEKVASARSLEAAPGAPTMGLETIVLTTGRPVLDVRRGAAVLQIEEMESQIWKPRLANASGVLAPVIEGIGRIELSNHPRGVDWIGTGWLVADDVVVTNRHVAEVFGKLGADSFEFRMGLGGQPMSAGIDFLEEFDREESHEFVALRILHIEADSGPDVAFLRVAPKSADDKPLPKPVKLAANGVDPMAQVAVIGYPARDPFFVDPALMDRIFQNRYDKKRLAPGLVTETGATELLHDCTTLGGNSGAAVVSLETGRAVALHFAGTLFETNHAVPAEVVGNRLADALAGRTRPRRRPADPPRGEQPAAQAAAGGASSASRVLTAVIPIRVQIEIGDALSDLAPRLRPAPAVIIPRGDFEEDEVDTLEEARPEDFLDRQGFNVGFLENGVQTPFPLLTENTADTLKFEFDGAAREVLHYRHFSVLMSRGRRLCRYSACNIDGRTSVKRKRKGWRFDPRIPKTAQIRDECYGNPPQFSRGHMTRRLDPVWGPDDDPDTANTDSMTVTNAVPQIQPFNAGIWVSLEDYALDHTREDAMRISVFTGPFLEDDDPVRFGVQIPISFWKVIAFIHDDTGRLSATGYIMSQRALIGIDEFVFGQHESSQRPIAEIEQRAGLSFGPLSEADPLDRVPESALGPLVDPSQIRFTR